MSLPTLDRLRCREVDRRATEEYGISGLVLMENAGRGVVDKLCELGVAGRVVVCCGKGNNAGDGFVIARHLDIRRVDVRVLLFADPTELTGDAQTNYKILAKTDVSIDIMASHPDMARLAKQTRGADWIVDALLGTGARGEPRPPLADVIDWINDQPTPCLAVDLPSGLDCDTGAAARRTVRADHTCTFVAAKPGFYVAGAEQYTGTVHVLDIGAPRKLVDEILEHTSS